MPYNIPVLKELYGMGYDVHVVRWDIKKLTPYEPPLIKGVTYYKRSEYKSKKAIFELVEQLCPKVIYTSGWMDKDYSLVAKRMRSCYKTPVIAACDSQWRGHLQWLNIVFSPFRHKKWFSHILVAGMWQYEYARRLGFKKNNILTHVYSADVDVFGGVDVQIKAKQYPKNMLFVGRFSKEKGLENLIEAWESIPFKNGWTLTLIGNGPMKESIPKKDDIIVKDFMDQKDLVIEMQNSGCFVLPSLFEPWALVLHEAAAAGLPILASERCGAVPYFVLEGYNGFLFDPTLTPKIKSRIEKFITLTTDEMLIMSENSRALSSRINPKIVASAIVSVIK